jgi:hypothetical protein
VAEPTERDLALIGLLEGRRGAHDQSMWQASALIIAAQAFLLPVLANGGVALGARIIILIAGALASVAAVASLLRLRSREVSYSEAVSKRCTDAGLLDPRPDRLEGLPAGHDDRAAVLDARLRDWSGRWTWPVYWWWIAALALFVAADVAALASA